MKVLKQPPRGVWNPLQEMLSDLPTRIIDQNSFTSGELAKAKGMSVSTVKKICTAQVEAGKWEQVFKRIGRNVYQSYRKKKP